MSAPMTAAAPSSTPKGATPAASPGAPRHVVVAGAGFIGLASAIELRGAGWDVTLVDPGPSGGEQAAS